MAEAALEGPSSSSSSSSARPSPRPSSPVGRRDSAGD
eukprot:CAMPEP_0171779112 /NCGR_PEP_ID=MMETSP0991-20121206/58813_1 /TAXON_ID=483369 /ORGANISM="non described non described, Strain CCMP2098" /LENGTH=36 /DNA_ID= /DNA_START= /DNA_END= /DNA_ORIENTATION=